MSSQPGRHDPCPCGSGRKFKTCHGSFRNLDTLYKLRRLRVAEEIRTLRVRREAMEFQRREQQGLGKAIISAQLGDHRVVAVGNTVHVSKTWNTFHHFVNDYPKILLGRDWWLSELGKSPEERHCILSWAVRGFEQMNACPGEKRADGSRPMTGAISAYMNFAYDLYALNHAVEVQKLLIERIRCPKNFPGALFEVRVAAALLRAGFNLQHQDESDRRTTHVEFIATHPESGTTYAVEAKRREGGRMKINRQLHRALSKQSEHPRVVFIDTNDGRLETGRNQRNPIALVEAENLLRRYEQDPVGKTLPAAYVIVTYDPSEHHLDAVDMPLGMLLWGFRLEDLKPGPKTLRQQVETRRRHAPIFALLDSMQKHRRIPATFDGVAEAFGASFPGAPLQVGRRLEVQEPDGKPLEVLVESGVVMLQWQAAACVVCSDDGQRFIAQVPLSDAELSAYAQHPATFFGVIDRNAGRKSPKTALDWFDFFWEAYSCSTREKLLEIMRDAPDLQQLKHLNREALATEYCVRMAESVMLRQTYGTDAIAG
jgi:hypothetical protein